MSDADIIYFIILGLWKSVSATDDEENSENYAIIKLMNEWKCNLMNETLRYDVLNNETIYKRKTYWNKIIYFIEIYDFKNS